METVHGKVPIMRLNELIVVIVALGVVPSNEASWSVPVMKDTGKGREER